MLHLGFLSFFFLWLIIPCCMVCIHRNSWFYELHEQLAKCSLNFARFWFPELVCNGKFLDESGNSVYLLYDVQMQRMFWMWSNQRGMDSAKMSCVQVKTILMGHLSCNWTIECNIKVKSKENGVTRWWNWPVFYSMDTGHAYLLSVSWVTSNTKSC